MALSAARLNLFNSRALKTLLGKHVSIQAPLQIQVAHMRVTHGEKYPYPEPWPYKQKKFNLWHEFFDDSRARLNENSKVLLVEGNVGCGKHDFARRLAKQFDLQYFPDVTEECIFSNEENGFDMRDLDALLPESARQYTRKSFANDPHPEIGRVGRLQLMTYMKRYVQYYRGLLHLFSTGQGIVMVRSPFSDRVFADAERRMGWLTKQFMPYYYDMVDNSVCATLKPHLTLYLDTPVGMCLENIKNRGRDSDVGPNINEKFLTQIERTYKESFLPRQRVQHEVVEIDWAEVGDDVDVEVIAEEIAALRLESEHFDDVRFEDWRKLTEDLCGHYRKLFASDAQMQGLISRTPPLQCPEVLGSDDDNDARDRVVWQHPMIKNQAGWAEGINWGLKTRFT